MSSEDEKPAPTKPTRPEEDLRLGDLVVIMAEPGPFTVVDIESRHVTIESPHGQRRKVREVAVRRVTSEPPVNT